MADCGLCGCSESERKNLLEFSTSTQVVARRIFPSSSGQPPHSTQHSEICKEVIVHSMGWCAGIGCTNLSVSSQLWGKKVFVWNSRWRVVIVTWTGYCLFLCLVIELQWRRSWIRSCSFCFAFVPARNVMTHRWENAQQLKWWQILKKSEIWTSDDTYELQDPDTTTELCHSTCQMPVRAKH